MKGTIIQSGLLIVDLKKSLYCFHVFPRLNFQSFTKNIFIDLT